MRRRRPPWITCPGGWARSLPGTGGSGLGLAVARLLVTAHGGTLTVPGGPGSTTFVPELPRSRVLLVITSRLSRLWALFRCCISVPAGRRAR
ncbi:ATP-binding protein [Streptomyces lavendulae]